jgi:hypothetical protein
MLMLGTTLRTGAYYLTWTYVITSCVYCLLSLLPSPLTLKLSQLTTISAQRLQNTSEPWNYSSLVWSPSPSALFYQTGSRRHATPESLFLSKAFDHSMRPSQVIPFYFRAHGPDGFMPYKDVTILTIVTSNRFSVFGRLAQTYGGK